MDATHTVFVRDTDRGQTYLLHIPAPTSQDDVWLAIMRKVTDKDNLTMEEMKQVVDDWGDDMLDIILIAVVPGVHECMYAQLTETTLW